MKKQKQFICYGVATLAVGLALLIKLWFSLWIGQEAPFLLFFAAVMVSAWYGGLGPGVWATFLSAFADFYFFFPPFRLFHADFKSLSQIALFTVEALFIGLLSARSRSAQERAEISAIEARREVTERGRAEERIRFQARLLDAVERAVIATDLDGTILYWNRFAEKLYGWPAEEVIGRPILEITSASGSREEGAQILERLRQGASWSGEFLARRRDGASFPVMVTDSPIYDDKGTLVGVVGISFDITEWKKRERRLAAQHAVTRVLSDSTTLGEAAPQILQALCEGLGWELGALWRLDRRANRLRCFESWRSPSIQSNSEFVMFSRQETLSQGEGLPGRVWSEGRLVWVPDLAKDRSLLRAPIAAKEGLHSACGFPIFLGGEIYGVLEFFSQEIRRPDKDLLEMMTSIGSQIGQFIERRRAEEAEREAHGALEIKVLELQKKTLEAQEVARLKSEFLSNISHELRTPLNAILGYTHLLIEETYGALGQDQKIPIEGILRNGEDLLRLVNDVLNFSRIEAGKLSVRLSIIEIPSLFEDVSRKLKPLIDEKSLSVQWCSPRNLPTIQSDAQKIRQILTNLVSNAIKFTPKGAVIIEARDLPQRDGVEIKVQDTGIGIKPEELPQIFDPFHQADGTSTREFGGVGLGLTIVKELTEALRGEIHAESQYGKGARFTLFLPYRFAGPLAKSA